MSELPTSFVKANLDHHSVIVIRDLKLSNHNPVIPSKLVLFVTLMRLLYSLVDLLQFEPTVNSELHCPVIKKKVFN